jgi:hypothetical protein
MAKQRKQAEQERYVVGWFTTGDRNRGHSEPLSYDEALRAKAALLKENKRAILIKVNRG